MVNVKAREDNLMNWFLDTETTGLKGPAIEVALVPEKGEGWSTLIAQQVPIEAGAYKVHGITDAECDAKGLSETKVATKIVETVRDGDTVWTHNVPFDRPRIEGLFARAGLVMPKLVWKCTLEWSRRVYPGSHKLVDLAKVLKFKEGGHRAYGDAIACRQLWHSLTTVVITKRANYVRVNGARIVWGAYYDKAGMPSEFKEFEVRSIDFKGHRFIAWDIRKDAKREYRFDRFSNQAIVDVIINLMA